MSKICKLEYDLGCMVCVAATAAVNIQKKVQVHNPASVECEVFYKHLNNRFAIKICGQEARDHCEGGILFIGHTYVWKTAAAFAGM